MVVSHHVVAGIWTPDLWKSSQVLLPTEPSHRPRPLGLFITVKSLQERNTFFFKDLFIYLLYVSTLQPSSDAPEEASDLITGGCEPPCGCWDLNFGPSEEQSGALTHWAISPAPPPTCLLNVNTFLSSFSVSVYVCERAYVCVLPMVL